MRGAPDARDLMVRVIAVDDRTPAAHSGLFLLLPSKGLVRPRTDVLLELFTDAGQNTSFFVAPERKAKASVTALEKVDSDP